eukprot:TRINITY_DN2359_c0_g1_i3.p1 TRINITY_DN2359_c0_g1~~TRINITY_DN2359_c0_g1_i3.p1  ORF type:complete len:615 (-),score=146.56 TRINITY_DN2359_c0_g1_i3:60-1820(-)
MGYIFRVFFLSVLLLACGAYGGEWHDHDYQVGKEVILWVNKVWPFRNPQETYLYYNLPWCARENMDIGTPGEGLGEALQGYELRQSGMQMYFAKDTPRHVLCKQTLTKEDAETFIYAIKNQYWYQMFLDDLPIWGMVGEVVENPDDRSHQYYIYTHKKFVVTFNDQRIIEVNLTSENPMLVQPGAVLEFSYSVEWHPTDVLFEDRFDKYLDTVFFEHQIHWFSIFNSFMMVIFLVGLVSMILMRTLRKDYARYSKDDDDLEDDRDLGDESGWKQVHGDVFRAPSHLLLFSSLIGTGHQLALLVLSLIIFSILGTYYRTRGTAVTAFIVLYALTSFVGGYGSGGYYARNGGKHWIQCMILTATLFPGVCFAIGFFLNFIAVGYGSLAAIPFLTWLAVIAIWGFVSFPLTLFGTVVGRNWNGVADNPCRINPVPRQIPSKHWYQHPLVNVMLGGILPFGSIFIEMYFIFTSFWHYKYYYVYGFMLLVYIILAIVSICVTIVSTYFLLNSEDYRWQWTSYLSSSSTALYVFIYSIYYFLVKTKMSGFFQTFFYFGYLAMFCIGLGILCGALGFIGTSVFVRRIYQIKID